MGEVNGRTPTTLLYRRTTCARRSVMLPAPVIVGSQRVSSRLRHLPRSSSGPESKRDPWGREVNRSGHAQRHLGLKNMCDGPHSLSTSALWLAILAKSAFPSPGALSASRATPSEYDARERADRSRRQVLDASCTRRKPRSGVSLPNSLKCNVSTSHTSSRRCMR